MANTEDFESSTLGSIPSSSSIEITKTCSTCKVTKRLSSFYSAKNKKHGVHSSCKDCHKKYVKEKAREKIREYQAYKESLPCTDCGVYFPHYVTEFDHKGEKSFNIGRRSFSFGSKYLEEEIEKCDLVCANCHKVRTYTRRVGL